MIHTSGAVFLNGTEETDPSQQLSLQVFGDGILVVTGDHFIHAYGNTVIHVVEGHRPQIHLHENSSVVSYGAVVTALDNSKVYAMKDTSVEASDFATVFLHGMCTAEMTGRSSIFGFDMSTTSVPDTAYASVTFQGRGSATIHSDNMATEATLNERAIASGSFSSLYAYDRSSYTGGAYVGQFTAAGKSRITRPDQVINFQRIESSVSPEAGTGVAETSVGYEAKTPVVEPVVSEIPEMHAEEIPAPEVAPTPEPEAPVEETVPEPEDIQALEPEVENTDDSDDFDFEVPENTGKVNDWSRNFSDIVDSVKPRHSAPEDSEEVPEETPEVVEPEETPEPAVSETEDFDVPVTPVDDKAARLERLRKLMNID